MNIQEQLEITIAHNLNEAEEVAGLYRRHWIALDWGRRGPDASAYRGRGKTDVTLFNRMRKEGAVVVASYKKATTNRSVRLVGRVEAGTKFRRYKKLLCLPLVDVQEIDSSRGFLGNLAPRQCTVQSCSNRAKGRLHALVHQSGSMADVWALHNHDVEWLVTNYLILTGLCKCVWSGARCYETIDHAGAMSRGRELLAQTTISPSKVREKAILLMGLAGPKRVLYLFGPREAEADCPKGIHFKAIEDLIPRLKKDAGGRWLVERMLPSSKSST